MKNDGKKNLLVKFLRKIIDAPVIDRVENILSYTGIGSAIFIFIFNSNTIQLDVNLSKKSRIFDM